MGGGGARSRKPDHSARKVRVCRGHVNSRQAEAEEQSPRGVARARPQDVLPVENTVGARLSFGDALREQTGPHAWEQALGLD